MSEKYLNVDIDDPRASAIAEVMSNKTSKKILSAIAEKEMSESDIAKELGLPLNTIGYNIEKLLKAELIEKSKNYFWSSKGKKIPVYRLSNKKILISPKKMIPRSILAAFGTIIGIVLIAIIASTLFSNSNPGQVGTTSGNQSNIINEVTKNFNSEKELEDYVKNNAINQGYGGSMEYYGNAAGGQLIATKDASISAIAPSSMSDESSRSGDYSQTNVQVEGVDEPDMVKNDGKYIYTISGNKIVIVDAFPPENMSNVSSIDTGYGVENLFVNGDKLIVFSNSYSYQPLGGVAKIAVDIMPCRHGGCGGSSMTNVQIYDISDRSKPTLESNLSMEGNYVAARMIGDYVYLINSKSIYSDLPRPPIYYANGVENKISATDVMYYPGYEDQSFSFTSIYSINLDNGDLSKKIYLTGSASTVFVSENNIFVTYQRTLSNKEYNNRFLNNELIPLLPDELQDQANDIMRSDEDSYSKYQKVMFIVENYSINLDGKEKEIFDENLQKTTMKFQEDIAMEYEKTVIMKIAIDKEKINMEGTGEVSGHLLNQFSMDEFEGNLRVATTTGQTWEGNSNNHIFVLDQKMKTIGKLNNLAPGERIYSVRFMGERAYLVTFKNVDPFFVIDLSDAENPEVLGYLKIPGYSDYLHPYDENYVIGIGKDVNESIDADKVHSEGSVFYTAIKGLKISLFDVRDVEHPKEVAKIVIGDRGSDSYALYDHRSFLFNKEKNLLVIPITVNEVRNSSYSWDGQSYEESYPVFQGAYVFNIDTNSIDIKGKITHISEIESLGPAKEEDIGAVRKDWNGNKWKKIAINAWKTEAKGYEYETYYDYQIDGFPDGYSSAQSKLYDYSTQIRRSLFMDDILYTISQNMIMANSLDDVSKINSLNITSSDQKPNYPITFASEQAVAIE